jgi:hypothetical protein
MFLLEIVGLVGIGRLGWHLGTSTAWSVELSALLVAIAVATWTIFRTRGFVPSGGEPVVAVPGPARVVIEFGFYAAGAWGLWASGWELAALVFALGVLVVTFALRDRLAGLLANRPPSTRSHP